MKGGYSAREGAQFYNKQLAQTLAVGVPGVEVVVNRIEVQEVTTC